MPRYDVPFVPNTPDEMHCLPASYLMIREHFEPGAYPGIEWEEWSRLVGFEPGLGAWSMAGLLWFKAQGYAVEHHSLFDYGAFAGRGADYLLASLGEVVGQWEVKYTDLPVEQARAKAFVQSGLWVDRLPQIEDIKTFLNNGYLVKCIVNQNQLNNLPGYTGHAVVVVGYEGEAANEMLIIHDPGPPAYAFREVPRAQFEAAWHSPNVATQKLDAIKKIF